MKHKGKTQHALCTTQKELIFCGMVGNWGGGGGRYIDKIPKKPLMKYMFKIVIRRKKKK